MACEVMRPPGFALARRHVARWHYGITGKVVWDSCERVRRGDCKRKIWPQPGAVLAGCMGVHAWIMLWCPHAVTEFALPNAHTYGMRARGNVPRHRLPRPTRTGAYTHKGMDHGLSVGRLGAIYMSPVCRLCRCRFGERTRSGESVHIYIVWLAVG